MKSDLDSEQQLSSETSPSSLKGCPKDGVVESALEDKDELVVNE